MEASPESEQQPPPRPKKHGGHGGHGGAWKVAYADFVTAMLALFIVLWILSQDEATKEAIQGYFRDPIGFSEAMGAAKLSVVPGQSPPTAAQVMDHLEKSLNVEVNRLQEMVTQNAELAGIADQIDIQITDEGIRIELRDNTKFNFFEVGSANITRQLRIFIELLTPEIQKLGYPIALEGHTDSRPYGGNTYTNWELSADRANSLRRTMIQNGLAPNLIREVKAFSDTRLHNTADPIAPENRRVSILLKTPMQELQNRIKMESPVGIKK
ncbi:MAG: OmpA family protein [bacterium]|nr:OmpA family protein [bacterium]